MVRAPIPLAPAEIRRIAAVAGGIDPRTVATYLDGTRTPFASTRTAIERALRKMKRTDLIRSTSTTAAA